MSTVISFIIIFGVIVLAHEIGHYLLGRKSGINVTEFFIGMGPTLFSFNKAGTKFSLKLFPIGGACLFEGETGNIGDKSKEEGEEKPEPGEGSFLKASALGRFATILAGPVFNFILAYIFAMIIVANTGIDLPIVATVTAGGQAEAAGLLPGDEIIRINNENIDIYRQIFFISLTNRGESLDITYKRGEALASVSLTPTYNEEVGRYLIGISASGEYVKSGPLMIFRDAYYELKFGMVSTLKSLRMLVQGRLGPGEIAGPVGMAVIVGDTYEMARPHGAVVVILSMLNIAMILSVNLGIINLLPLPALDGGRLIFIILELLRGKPIAPEKEGMVHLVGMIALLALMALLFVNDIARLFT